MLVSMRIHASCSGTGYDQRHLATKSSSSSSSGGGGGVPCFRQDITYRIICISEESDLKFRVQIINRKYAVCLSRAAFTYRASRRRVL